MLNHCSAERIAEDFARSEALGQAIIDAEYEPLAPSAPVAQYIRVLKRTVNVVEDTSALIWIVEALDAAA